MHSLEEKNHLSNELERLKKKVEETEQNKARLQSQLEAQNLEIYNIKLFGKSQHQQPQNTLNSVDFRYVLGLLSNVINIFSFFSPFLQNKYLGKSRDRNISGGNFEGVTKGSVRNRERSKANIATGNSF